VDVASIAGERHEPPQQTSARLEVAVADCDECLFGPHTIVYKARWANVMPRYRHLAGPSNVTKAASPENRWYAGAGRDLFNQHDAAMVIFKHCSNMCTGKP
jgi:hypothetical protein